MSLPQPSPLHLEIAPDADPADPSTWSWTDIIGDRREAAPVSIAAGRRDESSRVQPTKCSTRLNNRHGIYSNRNLLSPYYGQLRQNTPLRVRWGDYLPQVQLPGLEGSVLSTPDTAAIRVTGDCEVRWLAYIERGLFGHASIEYVNLGGRYEITGDERSWMPRIMPDGLLRFTWFPDGTLGSQLDLGSDEPFPVGEWVAGRMEIRMDDGSGNRRIDFHTGPSLSGPWTPLGSPAIEAGTSQLHPGNDQLTVGWTTNFLTGGHPLHGAVRGFQLWNGIEGEGGTVVADPGIGSQSPDATSWTGADGLPWSISGAAYMDDANTRHVGYVTEWPTRWDQSGNDSWVPIKAPGILRRLQQGKQKRLRSAIYQGVRSNRDDPDLIAYWPCEDGRRATQVAPGFLDGQPMTVTGDVEFAVRSPVVSTEPLLTLNDGTISGAVPTHPATGFVGLFFLLQVPDGGLTDGALIARVNMSGDNFSWGELRYLTGGGVRVTAADAEGNVLSTNDSGGSWISLDGRTQLIKLDFVGPPLGPDPLDDDSLFGVVRYRMNEDGTLEPFSGGEDNLPLIFSDTDLGGGTATSVELGSNGLSDAVVGHVVVSTQSTGNSDPFPYTSQFLAGAAGESAATRFVRLCQQEGLRCTLRGAAIESVPMGPQQPATLLSLLRECETAEVGGVLHEYGGGLAFTTRTARYTQPAIFELATAAGQLAKPPEPTDDDQLLVNDFTAERRDGSSARVIDQAHVERFGTYDDGRTFNVSRDNQLEDMAAWRVHLGTVDEYRWPLISMRLHHDPDLIPDWLAFRLGNRLTVEGAWEQLPGITIDLLAEGWSERISLLEWHVDMNCVPASPWRIATIDGEGHEESIIDTDGSELAAQFEAGTDTSMSVAVTQGLLWSTDSGDYPLDVQCGGVILRVTAVSGSSSPQTFAVDQVPVNGVEKTLTAGTDVRLATPVYIGL